MAGEIQRIKNSDHESWELIGFFDDNMTAGIANSLYGHEIKLVRKKFDAERLI